MMKNNKGLSTIVATLITILLVLVAVGIIWVVVRNVIQSGATQITAGSKCLDVDIKATKVICDDVTGAVCNATIARSAGGEAVGGVKLIFYNAAGDANSIYTLARNVNPLATETVYFIPTNITNASRVDTVAYFLDDSGNEQLCDSTNSLEF
jgi:hypothetical protein